LQLMKRKQQHLKHRLQNKSARMKTTRVAESRNARFLLMAG
jgi:hypothetical protein